MSHLQHTALTLFVLVLIFSLSARMSGRDQVVGTIFKEFMYDLAIFSWLLHAF